MKTLKVTLFILFISICASVQAQEKQNQVIKVNYTSTSVSDFMVSLLKNQITDEKELTSMIMLLEGYKVYSSYYLNVDTKEAVYVMDSIHTVDNIQTTGYTHGIHTTIEGDIYGKELFMGKDIEFKGHVNDIHWTMTNDKKEINGYQCQKANLNGSPEIFAWFTPEIAVKGGPYVYSGLPGLVLESNSPFEAINVENISYIGLDEFQQQIDTLKRDNNQSDVIALSEVFIKKDNFQRVVARGTM